MSAVKVAIADSWDSLDSAGPGAIYFPQPSVKTGVRSIILNCPGCGDRSAMAVYSGVPKPPSPSWEISGEGDKITLKPSINCVGCCKWHGWLTNGEYHL